MTDTPSLTLPLVQAAQAQKHVTVNEALVRLDGLTHLRLQARDVAVPPGDVVSGECYGVASGATGTWHGQDGKVAIGSNDGWVFVQPLSGWRAWIVDEACSAVFVNDAWVPGWVAGTEENAASRFEVLTATYTVGQPGEQDTNLTIPADALVFACSARVVNALSGNLTSWQLGVPGAADRFGSGLGLPAGSYCTGLLAQPTAHYADTPVTLLPVGGTLTGGTLRLALHCYRVTLPD